MTVERREPPVRVRVTGLQEAQLPALVRLENVVAALRLEAGVAPSLIDPWDEATILRATRDCDVRVLEADHQTGGYLVWRDQAPGVAVLERLVIDPEIQRYGLGTRMLREIGEKAEAHGIGAAVCLVPDSDRDFGAFLTKRGMVLVGPRGEADQAVLDWARHGAGQGRETDQLRLWWTPTAGLGFIPGFPLPKPTW